MIRAEFFIDHSGMLTGFHINGHAGLAEKGEDVLCAFVSSAAYMTANTITEIIGADADAEADDGDMFLTVREKIIECQTILNGLRLHLEETEKQYPEYLETYVSVI